MMVLIIMMMILKIMMIPQAGLEDYIDDVFNHNDDDYEDNYDQDGCSSTDFSP